MIKCNAFHYKKRRALSSFAVRKRSSCRYLYFLWVNSFFHRLKMFKVKKFGRKPKDQEHQFLIVIMSRMDLSKTSFPLVGPVECKLPRRYLGFRIHFIQYWYTIDLFIFRLQQYGIDLVFPKKSRPLENADHIR